MLRRAVSVSRIHTVAWPVLIAWPAGILLVAFLIPWVIFLLLDAEEGNVTGSVSAAFGIVLAFYLTAMTQTFPFALGMSVTRRDYFAATLLVAAAQILGTGVVLWGLGLIEESTDGWGVNMVMFDVPGQFTDNPVLQLGTYLAILALIAGAGLLIGALYQRWRVSGVYTFLLALLLGLGLAAIVITWQGWWPEVGHWFADTPRVVPMVLLPATLAVVCTGGAWATIRRATA
ncbi:ABC transporter permease [Nocardia cyriacigeorgica]|uniref:ABC transporter permease n=1 Tax=Nocardia cyriacigeorgica TaxID=135487 RepID=UPI001895EE73|nr:ABC transporter permease [Nocardia cyriacigeorgica]MBF6439316.1 ABC transporter permease [Nocardia cyriacigeorgica]MBF6455576.1 ABC transporter permease [Nocardia cyriacigeorgica]MBF6480516.1 ABC transporter permease [Nocardia cyriacigeorgica]MBF6553682.1 ABC transporter permease [Nocardia cyriacigeorgica]